MASIVSALDQFTNRNKGENGCIQYNWSKESNELLVQIYFQLVLTTKNIDNYYTYVNTLLQYPEKNHALLEYSYKLIGQTRDIIQGKGLYHVSYMMLGSWVKLCYIEKKANPENIKNMLKHFVELNDEHPYGSWKDLKYFANYCVYEACLIDKNHELVHFIAEMYAHQLALEYTNDIKQSLCARWVPRENSKKFGWLSMCIALKFVNKINTNHAKSRMNTLKIYRKAISELNKRLDTTQIKQCAKEWKNIDFENVTSITMSKQKNAFLNKKTLKDNDRVICANKLKTHIKECFTYGKKNIKGKRVSVVDMVKHAMHSQYDNDLANILELQWNDNARQNEALENIIPMVDVSGSMTQHKSLPLYSAIGLGLRCAEKSRIGNRVLTFSEYPSWIMFEDDASFIQKVNACANGSWGQNTNIESAFDLILKSCIYKNLSPAKIRQLCLVIFSDMQFDVATGNQSNINTMFESIKKKYYDTGINHCGIPYDMPSIIFWNLSPTNGFPVVSSMRNVVMVSGNSPALLNIFIEKGADFISSINSWDMFLHIIDVPRYESIKYIS